MTAIAEGTTFDLVVLATAKVLSLNLFCNLFVSLEDKFERLELGALMRSVTERLILRFSTRTVIVSLAFLKLNLEGLSLGDLSIIAIFLGELNAISDKIV